jgi:hypothetical protein
MRLHFFGPDKARANGPCDGAKSHTSSKFCNCWGEPIFFCRVPR